MKRGDVFDSLAAVKYSLGGLAVVAVEQRDGSLEVYDDPKDPNVLRHHRHLCCNLAGAAMLYGDKAIAVNFSPSDKKLAEKVIMKTFASCQRMIRRQKN